MKAVLTENIHPVAKKIFEDAGITTITFPKALDEEELLEYVSDIHFLGVRSRTKVSAKVLKNAPLLLAIGAFSIGFDNIDTIAAMRLGIPVFNAPYSSARSVAELAIAEIILLLRNVLEKNTKMHQGIWDKSLSKSHEVRGKTLGIIGYGNIGSQVGHLAEDLGMEVLYYDVVDKLRLGNAKPVSSLEELLAVADVVTIHVDGRPENKHLIGKSEIQKMKDGAILINLSRGFVVDLEAVREAILSGKLRGAGIDVFPDEPKEPKSQFSCPLQGLPNVFLTPHIGGSTVEAQFNIGEFVARKLLDYYTTGSTTLSLNFPHVQLPPISDGHRFIHIHENVPGILSELNTIFAQHNVNIVAQYLRTNERIGYVITDIERDYPPSLLEKLHKIRHTIRVRILY